LARKTLCLPRHIAIIDESRHALQRGMKVPSGDERRRVTQGIADQFYVALPVEHVRAVINKAFPKRFFKGENPIGRHFASGETKYSGRAIRRTLKHRYKRRWQLSGCKGLSLQDCVSFGWLLRHLRGRK
jgi:hypothetical protein